MTLSELVHTAAQHNSYHPGDLNTNDRQSKNGCSGFDPGPPIFIRLIGAVKRTRYGVTPYTASGCSVADDLCARFAKGALPGPSLRPTSPAGLFVAAAAESGSERCTPAPMVA